MVLSLIPFQSWESHNRLMLVSSRPYIFSHFRLTINEKIHRNSSNPITERLLNSLHLRINLLILIARILLRHIFKAGSWRTGLTLKFFFPPKERCPKAVLDISSVDHHTQIWGNQVSFSFIFYLLFFFAVEK